MTDRERGVILDTNVFVAAAFNPHSDSARILAGVEAGEWFIVWNEATRRETLRTVGRIPPIAQRSFGRLFAVEGEFAGPTDPGAFALIDDPDDRKFAALAAATGAPLITNDDDLLAHRDALALTILTPREWMASRRH